MNPRAMLPAADGVNVSEDIWQKVARLHENVCLICCGHTSRGYLRSTGDKRQHVHQMLFDTQSAPRGGEGWLRLLEFLPDDRTVRVRTYSTRLDQWDTSAGDDFTFLLTPVSTTGRIQHDARCRIAGCTENRTPGEAGTSETALARLLHSREVERKSDDLNPKMRSSPACSTGQAGRFPELASPVHLTAPSSQQNQTPH